MYIVRCSAMCSRSFFFSVECRRNTKNIKRGTCRLVLTPIFIFFSLNVTFMPNDKHEPLPRLQFQEKDQYGNEVQRLSRPLPVEYLLVDVPATAPVTPTYFFTVREDRRRFPVENRPLDGHLQDFHALSSYLSQWQPHEFADAINDFHLLIYLARMDMLPVKAAMQELLDGLRRKDVDAVNQWRGQEVWRTLETLIAASSASGSHMDDYQALGGSSAGMAGGGGGSGGSGIDVAGANNAEWTCDHCTYINAGDMQSCDMCSLPR